MSQVGFPGGNARVGPPVDANGNVLLPTDGMPPPPPLGSGPDFSASMTLSTDDQVTLADLFFSVLHDTANSDGSHLDDAWSDVKNALASGETPDARSMRMVMDALKKSIDDGTVHLDDPATLALVQAMVAQSHAARPPQVA